MKTSPDKAAVRSILDEVRREGRTVLTAREGRRLCEAYGIAVPREALATSASEAAELATAMGFPVVLKIISPDILHKTEAKGVLVGLTSGAEVARGYDALLASAHAYKADARISGVAVQEMLTGGQEVIIGAVSDPSFGKLVAFGVGGVLVEVLKDSTFRLAPASEEDARSMLDSIRANEVLRGTRGTAAVDRDALANAIVRVSRLVSDFPEIAELDLNPVFARAHDAIAADVRILADFAPRPEHYRPSQGEILGAMRRILRPASVAVIGASAEEGKIGNSIMKNLIGGGYQGAIYPIHPRAQEILGHRVYASVRDVPGDIDVAVFAIPARSVAKALVECGEKRIPGAVLIPSGFAETGNVEGQREIQQIGRKYNIRLLGPNIYGIYYLPAHLSATFCTPFDVAGHAALASQSGGIGMAIIGFSRAARMGVSAIIGVGNKVDVDEDDLLTFFEQDPNTSVVALHLEDLKDGRSFAEVAKRVTKKKPVVVLKGGRTAAGARAAKSHTAALAGNDKIYDDILRQCGVVRAPGLRDMLEYARALPIMPTPKGENVLILTGAGGSGVLLADACVANGLALMAMPPDLDAAFRRFIPPFGAAGNPVDITGGEPPSTYRKTIQLAFEEDRVHALVIGYWHTIITPPMVFAKLAVEVIEEMRAQGKDKPVVASLAGDVGVEEASEYLFAHDIPAYPYTTEVPPAVLGAKYHWARGAGAI